MPIGTDADYVPADIKPASRIWPDEDIIILSSKAPRTPIYEHDAGWNKTRDRCSSSTGRLLRSLPIPPDFFTTDYTGITPNHSCGILGTDGRTLYQNQPFHRCEDITVTQYEYPKTVDLYGDGIPGSHGGSGLSSIGGTIRLGELVPGGRIPHVLKVTLWCFVNCYYNEDESDSKPGFRWPATNADGVADSSYQGSNPEVQMGSLLALLPGFEIAELYTEPGKIIATALRDYGAYIADDAAWNCFHFATEWSPEGRLLDEFRNNWGFDFIQDLDSSKGTDGKNWLKDIQAICTNLQVVRNNSPESIGGGGTPLVPLTPELEEPVRTDSTNLVRNGSFSNDKEHWAEEIWTQDGYHANVTVENDELHATLTDVPDVDSIFKIQIKQIIEGLEPNTRYILTFRYRTSLPGFIVQIMNDGPDYTSVGLYQEERIVPSTDTLYYDVNFTTIDSIPEQVRLSFSIASGVGDFFLDDVVLKKWKDPAVFTQPHTSEKPSQSVTIIVGTYNKIRASVPAYADHVQLSLFDISGRQILKSPVLPSTATIPFFNNSTYGSGACLIRIDAYCCNRIINRTTTPNFFIKN